MKLRMGLAIAVLVAAAVPTLAQPAEALAAHGKPRQGVIPVPTYIAGAYEVVAAGHDSHSYWLHYRRSGTESSYSVVVDVRGRLPQQIQWNLPFVPRPAEASQGRRHSVRIVGTISDAERQRVRAGFTPASRPAFVALAGARNVTSIDERRLDRRGSKVAVYAFLAGSLSTRVYYGIRFGGLVLLGGIGVAPGGRSFCAVDAVGTIIGYFPILGARLVRASADGSVLAAGQPSRDPVDPRGRVLAFRVPPSVSTVDISEDGQSVRQVDVPACVFG